MPNQIKLAAIAILIIVIGSGSLFISGVFKPKKSYQLAVNSSSVSSVSSSVVSTSSTPVSSKAVSSESQVSSSAQTVQSSSKVVEVVSSKTASVNNQVTSISFDCQLSGKFESGNCNILDQNKSILDKFESTGKPLITKQSDAEADFYTDKRAYGLCTRSEYKFNFGAKKLALMNRYTSCSNSFFQNNPE